MDAAPHPRAFPQHESKEAARSGRQREDRPRPSGVGSLLGMGQGTPEGRSRQTTQSHLYGPVLRERKANISLSHTRVFTGKAAVGEV